MQKKKNKVLEHYLPKSGSHISNYFQQKMVQRNFKPLQQRKSDEVCQLILRHNWREYTRVQIKLAVEAQRARQRYSDMWSSQLFGLLWEIIWYM